MIVWVLIPGYDFFQDNTLPPTFFIQADNCGRENKNHFVLAFCELLVAKNIFQEVCYFFLNILSKCMFIAHRSTLDLGEFFLWLAFVHHSASCVHNFFIRHFLLLLCPEGLSGLLLCHLSLDFKMVTFVYHHGIVPKKYINIPNLARSSLLLGVDHKWP